MDCTENTLFKQLELASRLKTEVRLADFTCDYSVKDRAPNPKSNFRTLLCNCQLKLETENTHLKGNSKHYHAVMLIRVLSYDCVECLCLHFSLLSPVSKPE